MERLEASMNEVGIIKAFDYQRAEQSLSTAELREAIRDLVRNWKGERKNERT